MSNIYIQEPPTSGKVLLSTSVGEIEIELWSREAPKACRNFIQLGLEGYYNGTIFHRIVKGFVAQGGDPTGTGTGGESIYGEPFKDEIHTRLRFNRRGLVAMANAGKDDNSSQFFFTFGAAPELQNKHTIFAKVVGETLFNMLKLEDLEVNSDDRPMYPPKLLKFEVLNNPFTDIILRERQPEQKKESLKDKFKVSAVKNFKLLSFGDEAEEDEEELTVVGKKFEKSSKSTHDLLNDPKFSSKSNIENDLAEKESKAAVEKVRQKLLKKPAVEEKFQNLKKEMGSPKSSGTKDKETREEKSKDKKQAKSEYFKELSKYSNRKKQIPSIGSSRENQTLALLEKFKQNMEKNTDDLDPEISEESKKTESEWMKHTFKCFSGKQPSPLDKYNKFHEIDRDMYDISDPRNSINKRRREDSQKSIKNKRNPYHS